MLIKIIVIIFTSSFWIKAQNASDSITLYYGDVKKKQVALEEKYFQLNNNFSGFQDTIKTQTNSINSEIEIIKNDIDNSITELKKLINQNLIANNLQFDVLENNVTSLTDSLLTASHRILIMKDQASYDEAFTAARLKLGPGQRFEWRGKWFNTDFKNEEKRPETIKYLEGMKDSILILKSTLKTSIEAANALINKVDSNVDQKYQTMDETISNRTLYSIIVILVILILFIAIFVFFKLKMGEQIDSLSSIRNTQEKLESEAIDLDKKLIQILEQKLEIANLEPQQTKKADHSLPLTLGSEIHRMRKRLKTMDESQSTKVLNNRIDSLEEKLHDMGYEIVNLEGQPYDEGMNINARIIETKELSSGEKKITRVIKPHIKYKNEVIQGAEVEVSQGI